MKTLASISRVVLALLFIFSGTIKGIDPVGSALKFSEYFGAFGLDSLRILSPTLSVVLSAIELTLGLMLLMRIRIAFTSLVTLIFIGGFTVFTLLIAITNPVADCGCFGDAIKLTNWQSFFKNVIFSILAIIAFLRYRHCKSIFGIKKEILTAILLFLTTTSFFILCYQNVPAIDLLPYRIGTDIRAELDCGGNNADQYKSELYYKNLKTGKIQVFTLDDTTWCDETQWEFVDSKSILVNEAKKSKIKDLFFFNNDGIDVTDSLLQLPRLIILTAQNTQAIPKRAQENFEQIISYGNKFNYNIISLTSGSGSIGNTDTYTVDATTLKTMIRPKEGVILIDNGVITGKWSANYFPKLTQDHDNLMAKATWQAHYGEVINMTILLSLILILYLLFRFSFFTKK